MRSTPPRPVAPARLEQVYAAVLEFEQPGRAAVRVRGAACANGRRRRCRDGNRLLRARAHQIGELTGWSTTNAYRRNLVNRRDEPHAGAVRARLHLIGFDANLQPAVTPWRFVEAQ